LISFVEQLLLETGNYHGFTYLTKDQVPELHLPGIIPKTDGNHEFLDETRRSFVIQKKI